MRSKEKTKKQNTSCCTERLDKKSELEVQERVETEETVTILDSVQGVSEGHAEVAPVGVVVW